MNTERIKNVIRYGRVEAVRSKKETVFRALDLRASGNLCRGSKSLFPVEKCKADRPGHITRKIA